MEIVLFCWRGKYLSTLLLASPFKTSMDVWLNRTNYSNSKYLCNSKRKENFLFYVLTIQGKGTVFSNSKSGSKEEMKIAPSNGCKKTNS